jgi:xylose isomerase
VFLYNYRNVVRRKQNDYVYQRAKSADSVATKRLKHAKKLMEESQFQPFYEECYKAILGYIGDKTNIGIGELSKDRIKEIISAKKDGAAVAQEVARLLETCEFARFAPMGTNEQVSDFYNNCVQQINKLESIL